MSLSDWLANLVKEVERDLRGWIDKNPPPGDPSMPAPSGAPSPEVQLPRMQIVNHSSTVTDEQLAPIAAACQRQAREHFAPAWNGCGANTAVDLVPEQGLDPKAWQIVVADTIDAADALGYHDQTEQGRPIIKIGAGVVAQYGGSLSVTISHEVLEALADPTCQWWSVDERTGVFYALETADAVEADECGYELDGVLLSDFVLPAFFDNESPPPYDKTGHVTAPFQTLPGGYQIVFHNGRVSQVYGDREPVKGTANRERVRKHNTAAEAAT